MSTNKSEQARAAKRAYEQRWRKTHKANIKESQRKWHATHREQVNAYARKWRADHREQSREYSRTYWERRAKRIEGGVADAE